MNSKPKVILFTGPSTCGKSTIVKELLKQFKSVSITIDRFFDLSIMPEIDFHGRKIRNNDCVEAVNWDKFLDHFSKIDNTDLIFLDAFIFFCKPGFENMVDAIVDIEYEEGDMMIGMRRRMVRKGRPEPPEDYASQDPWSSNALFKCHYFADVVWKLAVDHPEYRVPPNWNKPIIKLSAKDDIEGNIRSSAEFVNKIVSC